jgi:threonine synthase
MDISKASNFERYVFDIVGRDAAVLRGLWAQIGSAGGFDLAATAHWPKVAASGFVSGTSTHADRLSTIRGAFTRHHVILDPHTADGVHVGRLNREEGVPLVCIETALPAKFAVTIKEALGREPDRPSAYTDLEGRSQHFTVLPADAERVKAYIAAHAGP